ncbi:hypothetical protein O6H91_23G071300 [Diphasiastrum complanatum]|uniref:Uncharacterized protein n=1 Tax=Diphasiastrum complanatum TaxID=34168 RepID=A0ACC2ABZ1_DIPCM|nr:hypothetical protein O6H91_23G071300 [Diphasiastrum complanatum]
MVIVHSLSYVLHHTLGSVPSPTSLLSDNSNFSMEGISFRPNIAVFIGVLTTMFSLTFLLLICAKHCRRNTAGLFRSDDVEQSPTVFQTETGVDQGLMDSLPTFSFASLKGDKAGLECAICLSRYSENEILRLLPKCKHAFHVDCADRWLVLHSTCPLCRYSVSSQDLLLMDEIFAARRSLDVTIEPFQLLLQQEDQDEHNQPSPTSSQKGGLMPASDKAASDLPLATSKASVQATTMVRRFGHSIIVSDVLLQPRWSDLVPSDVLFLDTQTLFWPSDMKSGLSASSARAGEDPILRDIVSRPSTSSSGYDARLSRGKHETGAGKALADGTVSFLRRAFSLSRINQGGKSTSLSMRSMSEMTGFDMFSQSRKKDVLVAGATSEAYQTRDVERMKKWLSIAKQTIARLRGSKNTSTFD